jgi:hypothetical protein
MNDNTPHSLEEQNSSAPLPLKLPYAPPHVVHLSAHSAGGKPNYYMESSNPPNPNVFGPS